MIQAEENDGGIHEDAADCGDVGKFVAGKFNRPERSVRKKAAITKVSITEEQTFT